MTILILIVGIIVLILIHELGHFIAAKIFRVKVEEFGFGFPPRLASKKIGETRYSINAVPFGGFVRLYGENPTEREKPDANPEAEDGARAFYRQAAWKRVLIIISGVAMNFVIGWLITAAIFAIGSDQKIVVSQVAAGSPAEAIGILPNDVLLGFKKADDFISFVNENRGQEISIQARRTINKETGVLDLRVMPRVSPPPGEGALGVAISELGVARRPVFQSLADGFRVAVGAIGMIFAALYRLFVGIFTGGVGAENFVGPVGIVGAANEAAGFGIIYLFQLLAIISLNLAALNILPIPALDGGRLFFIIVEKIKGSPVPYRKESIAHAIGFLVLLLLMIAITVKDIHGLL